MVLPILRGPYESIHSEHILSVASQKNQTPCNYYLFKTTNNSIMGVIAEVLSSVLLFSLVFMSATVDIRHIFKQLRNWQALLVGSLALQFDECCPLSDSWSSRFWIWTLLWVLHCSSYSGRRIVQQLLVQHVPTDLALSVTMTAIEPTFGDHASHQFASVYQMDLLGGCG
jgi:hypothetical protein